MKFLEPEAFFDLASFEFRDLFAGCKVAWEALANIPATLERGLKPNVPAAGPFGAPLPETVVLFRGKVYVRGFKILGGDVAKGSFRVEVEGEETGEAVVLYAGSVLWDGNILIGPGSVVEPGALIKGPAIIGSRTEVRQGAYIRGKCIVGNRCVVGHTTEMKASIMLDGAKAGHFAYIGDSILGNDTNLGAGTKLANLKIRGSTVRVRVDERNIDTGLRKFGAILGDRVEIGCNSVTNPGTMLGKGCLVFPVMSVRAGYYGPEKIVC